MYLVAAMLQSILPLTGIGLKSAPAMTLYTGDLVAHDTPSQMSHDYVEAVEDVIWKMLSAYIPGPIYVALGVRCPITARNNTPADLG